MGTTIIAIPELNAIIEVLEGELSLPDLVSMKREELAQNLLNADVRTLADARRARLLTNSEELAEFARWQLAHNNRQVGARTAILADRPLPRAILDLFSRSMASVRTVAVFSELEAALGWLRLDPDLVAAHWPGAELARRAARR